MKKEILVFVLGFLFLFGGCYLIEQYGGLSDALKFLYFWSGWLSFECMILGLILKRWGRFLGLVALEFALIHLSIFVYFDFNFAWDLMQIELVQKYYIYYGICALGIMLVLGFFSFVGTFWHPLFYGVLGAIALGLMHIVMIQKVLKIQDYAVIFGVYAVVGWKLFQRLAKVKH